MRAPAVRSRPLPPDLGLLAAASPAGPDGPDRWAEGLTFGTADCGRLRIVDPCGPDTVTLLDRPGEATDYDPFLVQAFADCSAGGGPGALFDAEQRARETLDALTGFAVERELWTGELARAAGWPNRALTATDADVTAGRDRADILTTGTTGVSPRNALGLLGEALGSYPGRGVIHAGLLAAALLGPEVERTGNVLRTRSTGTLVIPGAGYLRTGPDGADAPAGTAWLYGTGPVTVRLSPPVVPTLGAEALDRATNSVRVVAERMAAATWDGCAHVAVLMTLTAD